ncbi:hypothetical protein BCR36DRAFT_104628 [Piromyces finnis]|uniref:Uncharacterized protein n=1 Tax=Piromyces finnis TaxID=1754191 RepID=A0A1Y1V308_9FUNG|nr:hypothetical protein BCR36DRAFT_104628 [Piromyces finnis]|eukprot:ORX46162.1 hypothetical protein BCR36DRAFT_104628 [Piromyces finnis]
MIIYYDECLIPLYSIRFLYKIQLLVTFLLFCYCYTKESCLLLKLIIKSGIIIK